MDRARKGLVGTLALTTLAIGLVAFLVSPALAAGDAPCLGGQAYLFPAPTYTGAGLKYADTPQGPSGVVCLQAYNFGGGEVWQDVYFTTFPDSLGYTVSLSGLMGYGPSGVKVGNSNSFTDPNFRIYNQNVFLGGIGYINGNTGLRPTGWNIGTISTTNGASVAGQNVVVEGSGLVNGNSGLGLTGATSTSSPGLTTGTVPVCVGSSCTFVPGSAKYRAPYTVYANGTALPNCVSIGVACP